MISVSSITNFGALDAQINRARTWSRIVQTVAKTTFAEPTGQPALLAGLRVEPQRAVHPFPWSHDPAANARAQRKYFQMIRDGLIQTDSYGYVRTHELANSYRADLIITTRNEVLISVSNKANRAHLYTKGLRQVPGHVVTGWQKDTTVIDPWVRQYITYLTGEILKTRTAVGL
jgi:hypothetical protein